MLYLLDANVLITASKTYYLINRVPEFWSWLTFQGRKGNIKIPIEIIDEVKAGTKENDLLLEWIDDPENETALLLNEDVDPIKVQYVVSNGYALDLTDNEIESLGKDPFLIAYALSNVERCVVTTEVSKASRKRQNQHIPDICRKSSVNCCNTFDMNRTLNFSTRWNRI